MPEIGTASGLNLAVLLAVLVLPGLLIGAVAGLRGWLLAAGAPVLTFGLIGVAGSVLPVLGLSWTPTTFASSALVVAGVVGGTLLLVARLPVARLPVARPGPEHTAPGPGTWRVVDHVAVGAAVLVSAALGVLVTADGTEAFTAIPQFWDTAFHSNAIRYIADTGESSPAALAALSDAGVAFYYPNAFHIAGATLMMLTGTGVMPAVEFLIALLPALFALGVAALVKVVSGRPAVAVASALVAAAFSGFPYDLAGVLLPYVMGLALLPAFLAQWADVLVPAPGVWGRAVALGLGAVGLLALHPSTLVAAAVVAAFHLAQVWWTRRPVASDAVVIGVGALATAVFGAPLLLASAAAAAGESFDWPVAMPAAEAVGRLLTLAHGHENPQWWLAGLVVLGLAGLRRHPELRFLAASGLVFAVVFVMAASYEGQWVELLSRPWWNDRWRLVALWVVVVVPLAGAGVVALRDTGLDLLRRIRVPPEVLDGRGRVLPAALLAVLLLGVAVASDGLYRERNTARIAAAFTDGPAVSRAEEQAFLRLAEVVPPGARVMNDPYDGSPLMYALAGALPVFVQPLHEQLDLAGLTPERRLLFTSFHRLDDDPAVRDVVRQMGITHAVVSDGLVYTAPGTAPGMRELDRVDSLHLLFRTPSTTVYEVRLDDGLAAG